MNDSKLEQVLMQLPAPPTPSDLAARCFETIPRMPVRTSKWHRFALRFAIVAVVVAAMLWMRRPDMVSRSQNGTVAAAFAETETVMQKVTFFHCTEWQIGVNDNKKQWYVGKGMRSETWFDTERGFLWRSLPSPTAGPTYQQSLSLPDGSEHNRLYNAVRITTFSPKRWLVLCREIQHGFADLATKYHGFNYGVAAQPVGMTRGRWRARPANVFTFKAPPSADNAAQGAPEIRSVYFVDPATKRLIGTQWFASWRDQPNRAERKVQESEYDYAVRPPAQTFSPVLFRKGAGIVQRQKGAPGVTLSPEF